MACFPEPASRARYYEHRTDTVINRQIELAWKMFKRYRNPKQYYQYRLEKKGHWTSGCENTFCSDGVWSQGKVIIQQRKNQRGWPSGILSNGFISLCMKCYHQRLEKAFRHPLNNHFYPLREYHNATKGKPAPSSYYTWGPDPMERNYETEEQEESWTDIRPEPEEEDLPPYDLEEPVPMDTPVTKDSRKAR